MNKDFIEEIKETKNELEKVQNKLKELETKYSYINDYRLVAHLLDKLGVDHIETTDEEVMKCTSRYIAEHHPNGCIVIYKDGELSQR